MTVKRPRHAEKAVLAALRDTRVVLVNGARQAGKSTLVKKVLKAHEGSRWRTLEVTGSRWLRRARIRPGSCSTTTSWPSTKSSVPPS